MVCHWLVLFFDSIWFFGFASWYLVSDSSSLTSICWHESGFSFLKSPMTNYIILGKFENWLTGISWIGTAIA